MFYSWFITEYTLEQGSYIKVEDIYDLFKTSTYYDNINKTVRRTMTKKWFTGMCSTNPNMHGFYKARYTKVTNGTRIDLLHVLVSCSLTERGQPPSTS